MFNIETVIYIYIFVCLAVIVFNIGLVFSFQFEKYQLKQKEKWLRDALYKEISQADTQQKEIFKKLKDIDYLNLYTHILLELDEETRIIYLKRSIEDVCALTRTYNHKEDIVQACFAYDIGQLYLCDYGNNDIVKYMLKMVASLSSYCRENALNALYRTHEKDYIVKCILILQHLNIYHYDKLIVDGILSFLGNKEQLGYDLMGIYPELSLEYKVIVINVLRNIGNQFTAYLYELYFIEKDNIDVAIAIIRYFSNWKYNNFEQILKDIVNDIDNQWELRAISVFALRNYANDKVREILIKMISDRNWYVRYNAAESLSTMSDIYHINNDEIEDRYGHDIVEYMRQRTLLKDGDSS